MKQRNYKWITEASLAFLSKKGGYLLEGETPESRFKLIAKNFGRRITDSGLC